MTDATREQIKSDAREWWEDEGGPDYDPDGAHEDSFIDGAIHQHHIAHAEGVKEGRRQAIEESVEIIKRYWSTPTGGFQDPINELEKLKL